MDLITAEKIAILRVHLRIIETAVTEPQIHWHLPSVEFSIARLGEMAKTLDDDYRNDGIGFHEVVSGSRDDKEAA